MRLRGTDPRAVKAAVGKADAAGVNLEPAQIESHLLAGGDVGAVIDAMAAARQRGLPDNFTAIAEAQLAGVDLSRFIAGGYHVAGFETLADLRAAATTDPGAALRLANRLLAAFDEVAAIRAKGPRSLAERVTWRLMDQAFGEQQERVRAELESLLPRLPPGQDATIRARLSRGV